MPPLKIRALEVTDKAHWRSLHADAGYVARLQLIDDNILHFWFETDRPVLADYMDTPLIEQVLEECGITEMPRHMIWNLENLTGFSFQFKLNVADVLFNSSYNFIFNGQPVIVLVCFYNISEATRTLAETFAAIVSDSIRVVIAESLEEAIETIRNFKSGILPEDETVQEDAEQLEYNARKQSFLEAAARISLFGMLETGISLPPSVNRYYPFFKALDMLRSDFLEKERWQQEKLKEKESEFAQQKKEFDERLNHTFIRMNAQGELHKKSSDNYEKELSSLKSRVASQETELTRVSTAIAEKTGALRDLLDQIHALQIDTTLKRKLTDSCLSLIETETIEKRLNIELTESDSRFLSKLQKKHPSLNQRELRISLLVKLNYDTRDIAHSLGVSTRGMESVRYRIHKKLGLGKHQSIKTYLSDLSIMF
ncbi:MAG: transcriptional regulator [Chlorobiaceae bacterium]